MSINYLFSQISYLKEFIILTVMITIGITLYFGIINRKYSRGSYGRNIYSLFFMLDKLSRLRVAVFYLFFIYILSCLVRFQPMLYIHIYLFILIGIASVAVNWPDIKAMLFTFINVCAYGAILLVLNMLINYLINIRFNTYYLIIYILASVAMIMYCGYVLLHQILIVSKGRKLHEKK